MKITDLFSRELLDGMLVQGYVREQTHPGEPLKILNYTEKAQFDREWNDVTRACRGVIYNWETGQVVARPFSKFHNHDEPSAPVFGLDEAVTVTDKMDGSLGILYPVPSGGHAVATRGSFLSDQALHATWVWQERYEGKYVPPVGITVLFEIIYPANRIVVDYRGLDDLVLLGGIDVATGRSFTPDQLDTYGYWPGPRAEQFAYATFGEALAAETRAGFEGFVVQRIGTEDRVKIKYADYVALHRIVTGLNARTVWEHMGAQRPLRELIETLPDEFHEWVFNVGEALGISASQIIREAEHAHALIVGGLPEGYSRKDFALVAKDHDLRAYLFKIEDGRHIEDMVWKAIRPGADWTPTGVQHGEDAA